MYKKANLTAALDLQDVFMDFESEDSILDRNYSDVSPHYSDLFSAPSSRLRPNSRPRSFSRTRSETE